MRSGSSKAGTITHPEGRRERVEKALIGLLEAPNRQMRIAAAGAIADAPSPKGLAALRIAAEVEVEPFSRRVLSEARKRAERNVPPP